MKNFTKKSMIITEGSPNELFYIIAKGTVVASVNGKSILLGKGDIVGILDITLQEHSCSYIAADDVSLIPYEFTDTASLVQILDCNPDLKKLLLLSFCRIISSLIRSTQSTITDSTELFHFVTDMIAKYQTLCHNVGLNSKSLSFMENLESEFVDDSIPFYFEEYFAWIKKMGSVASLDVPSHFVYGFLARSHDDISYLLDLAEKHHDYQTSYSSYLLNEDHLDIFDLYCDLYFRFQNNSINTEPVESVIENIISKLKSLPSANTKLIEKRIHSFRQKMAVSQEPKALSKEDSEIRSELSHSVQTILSFADSMNITSTEFQKYLAQYKELNDKSSMDRNADNIRKQLTKLFYLIYNEVIQENMNGKPLTTVVKMFLNFGYVDPELCGYENAIELYKLTENYHGIKEQGIYTFYEWIMEIYKGNKQPSRNEFDVDYASYLRMLKREGKISAETETELADDPLNKVMYELQNMFTQVNKITSGRILSYCPILTEEYIIKPFADMLVTPVTVVDQFSAFKNIDYSAFYHEVIFNDQKTNIKETIYLDIRPDVILMPNIGSRGVLWQEIEGMYRATPGRMMLSAFHVDNIQKTFARMIGEFRWEMCKRDMGARWNDFSVHSLTSDYCDYAQFFNKNRELSYDTKEKIRTSLKRCKNSYKELFISDYITFVLYESTGSCRLNKVARNILFTYCPFKKEIRDSIKGNGAFQNLVNRHRIKTSQEIHRLNQIQMKYQNAHTAFPEELENKLNMLSST